MQPLSRVEQRRPVGSAASDGSDGSDGSNGSGDSTDATQTRWPGSRPRSVAVPRLSWTQHDAPSSSSMSTLTSKPRCAMRVTVPWRAPGGEGASPAWLHRQVVRAHPPAAQPGGRPDEGEDELVGRAVVQLGRGAHLLEASVVDDGEAVGHLHRLFLVVRHEHCRHVLRLVQVAQPLAVLGLPSRGVTGGGSAAAYELEACVGCGRGWSGVGRTDGERCRSARRTGSPTSSSVLRLLPRR